MASTDELEAEILAEMEANPEAYADVSPINDTITIDPETRTVNLPASETLFGTEQEMDVERKYFKCPRIVGDNIDLSKHQIYIMYITAKDSSGTFLPEEGAQPYYCEDMAVDETGDYITFSWLLSGNVLSKPGFIAFAVVAKRMDGEVLKTRWKTKPAVGTVLLTVPDGASQIADAYPDIIVQLLDRMNEVEAIASEEAMQGYVEKYLGEHPVQIDDTLTDNTKAAPAGMVGELKGDLINSAIIKDIDSSNYLNGYINSSGSLIDSDDYVHTSPVFAKFGSKISVNACGYETMVAMISKYDGNKYTPLVLSSIPNASKEYSCILDEDTEVVISFYLPAGCRGKITLDSDKLVSENRLSSTIAELENKNNKIVQFPMETEINVGLFSTAQKNINTNYGYHYTSCVCKQRDSFKISGLFINGDFKLWGFVNNDGELVASGRSYDGKIVTSEEFIAPEDGTLYVNGDKSPIEATPKIYKLLLLSPFEYTDLLETKVDSLYTEVTNINNDVIQLQNTDNIIDFEIENIQRRILSCEKKNDFAWSTFDKPYFVFIHDDTNSWLEKYANVFIQKGVPLGCATIPSRLNDENIAILQNVVANGGEVLGHYGGSPNDETSDVEWLTYTRDIKYAIEGKGFKCRGLIRADNTAYKSQKGEKYCRLYFDYGNNGMGISTQFDLNRELMLAFDSLSSFKSRLDSDFLVNGIHGYGMHGGRDDEAWITEEAMSEIIDYILANGGEIVTYSYLYDTFGSSILEERIKALENTSN